MKQEILFSPKVNYVKQNYVIVTAVDSELIKDSFHVYGAGSGFPWRI